MTRDDVARLEPRSGGTAGDGLAAREATAQSEKNSHAGDEHSRAVHDFSRDSGPPVKLHDFSRDAGPPVKSHLVTHASANCVPWLGTVFARRPTHIIVMRDHSTDTAGARRSGSWSFTPRRRSKPVSSRLPQRARRVTRALPPAVSCYTWTSFPRVEHAWDVCDFAGSPKLLTSPQLSVLSLDSHDAKPCPTRGTRTARPPADAPVRNASKKREWKDMTVDRRPPEREVAG